MGFEYTHVHASNDLLVIRVSGSVECLLYLVVQESGPTSGGGRIPCPSGLNVAVTGGTGRPSDHWDTMRWDILFLL